MAKLMKEKNNQTFIKDVKIIANSQMLKGLFNDSRWQILKVLAEKPAYPAQIAKNLKMHEQKVYYHIRQLEASGLVEIVLKEEHSGALAKYYSPTAYAFALELPGGDESLLSSPMKEEHKKFSEFMMPFISGGKFNALIVVGSPDPHGPHQVRARDGHYAIELAMFFGPYAIMPKKQFVFLDTDVKSQKIYNENLIVIGGVLTNMVAKEVNKSLSIYFDEEMFPYRTIFSRRTGKTYSEENIGIIVKAANPKNPEKSVLIVAGNTHWGTKAAIKAITTMADEVFKNYKKEDSWGVIVQGFDLDGDGRMDAVKIIE